MDGYGTVSIWVNNAGGSPVRFPVTELSRKDWDHCIALNQIAVWVGITTAARHMKTGSIINISCGAGSGPVPGSGHYGAAKAAVDSLTQTASDELAPRIRVNGIAPGAVPTEIFEKPLGIETEADLADAESRWNIPMQRFGTPLDMGAAVLFLCSPGASWITSTSRGAQRRSLCAPEFNEPANERSDSRAAHAIRTPDAGHGGRRTDGG